MEYHQWWRSKYPAVVGEAEFKLLEEAFNAGKSEIAELERKLAEQQATILAIHKHFAELRDVGFSSKGQTYVLDMLALYNNPSEELNKLLAAAKEEGRKEAVPEGWQVVPKEPTEELEQTYYAQLIICGTRNCYPVWKAMLAAAPKPQGKTK